MKRIGFTKKYYTLWDVTVDKNYHQNERGQITSVYETVRYSYLGNLSFDLEKAQEKAKAKGCTNLEPDTDLYGRNKSWEKTTKKIVPESLEYSERDELLMICCSNRPENTPEVQKKALSVLLDKGYCKMINGIVTLSEFVDKMEQYFIDREDAINGELPNTFLIERNPDYEGWTYSDGFNLRFDKIKANYYNGFEYYLPVDGKGKTKRVKNKKIELLDFDVNYSNIEKRPFKCWKNKDLDCYFHTERDGSYLTFNDKPEIIVKDFKVVK